MKRLLTVLLIGVLCLSFLSLSVTADEVLNSENTVAFFDVDNRGVIEITETGISLKPGEWVEYSAEHLQEGAYKVYVSGTQAEDVYLAIGIDRHFECVLNKINQETTLEGRIEVDDDAKAIRVENTGTKKVTFEKIIIEKIDYESELKFDEKSASVGETVNLSGYFNSYDERNSVVLKLCYIKDGVVQSFEKYDISLAENNKAEISLEISAKEEKVTATFLSSDETEQLGKEAELLVSDAMNLYVSSSAKDGGNGTAESPFNSIEDAKAAVRQLNNDMTGDIIVNLIGAFNIDKAIEFNEEDSGKNGYKVVYKGNGKTLISGGKTLDKLVKVPGKDYYKTKIDFAPSRQLYINGVSARRAKSDKVEILSFYDDPNITGKTSEYDGVVIKRSVFSDGIPNFKDMQMVFSYSWHKAFVNITDIVENEEGNYIVKLSQPEFDAAYIESQTNTSVFHCYFENSPLFLDEQNEWCYVSETGEVLYYPKRFAKVNSLEPVMPVSEGLINIDTTACEYVENITFEGLKFLYGAWNDPNYNGLRLRQAEEMVVAKAETDEFDELSYHCELMPSQISVKHGKNININNCDFSLLGSVAVSFRNKSVDCSIKNSGFKDISAAAINIGDVKIARNAEVTEFCQNIYVENNYIENIGTDYPSSPAVTMYYANNTNILHNHINNVPYTGISLGWGWGRNRYNCRDNKVIGNKIEKVMQVMVDGGHIYTLSAMPGNIIAENYMSKSGDYRGGVYLDHTSQYMYIKNNVMEVVNTGLMCRYEDTYNKKYNTAEDNYSWVEFTVTVPELNNIEPIKSMYIKENYEIAKKITGEAGIVTK